VVGIPSVTGGSLSAWLQQPANRILYYRDAAGAERKGGNAPLPVIERLNYRTIWRGICRWHSATWTNGIR
jgi:hypothetical protein